MYPDDNKKILRSCISLFILLLLGFLCFNRTRQVQDPRLHGCTMGTTYFITLSGQFPRSTLEKLEQAISNTLLEVNRQMSTWDPSSEISAFNRSKSTAPFPVSKSFVKVIAAALKISKATDGAFDPTLNPLLKLWGFNSSTNSYALPTNTQVEETRARCGWQHLHVDSASTIRKDISDLELDLSAIAKGYAVDAVAAVLCNAGVKNYFVEIGGEVVVKGVNPDGKAWRIGVQYPSLEPFSNRLQGILHLRGGAIATSGDYRNYIIHDGITYSHIIDPRTGRPALHNVASVTVLATDCMTADAIATGLFVLGAEAGLTWVENHPDVEALFLLRNVDGKIIEKFSSGFTGLTDYTSLYNKTE